MKPPMARAQNSTPDYSWEKKFAPKVTRGQVAIAFAVYGAWIVFLLVLALRRWFGSLL
jgi:hypothetical protein